MTKSTSLLPALAIAALVGGFGGDAVAAAPAHPTTHSRQVEQSTQRAHARQLATHQHNQQASCGLYMYRHNGKCTDIRGEHQRPWTDSVF